MTNPAQPTYKIITGSEFKEQYGPDFKTPFGEPAAELAEIRRYEADAEGNVNFPADWVVDDAMNVVIDGNLIVAGNIEMGHDEEAEGLLFVTGNVMADSLVLSGTARMFVGGDVVIEHGILGCNGENGGWLAIAGETETPVVMNHAYFNMAFGKAVNGIVIDTAGCGLLADYGPADFAEVVNPELVKEDFTIDVAKAWVYLQQGKTVLPPGVKPARVLVEEYLQEMAVESETITKLDLNNKKLKGFPRNVLEMKSLKVLDLSHNPIGRIPAEIDRLADLEELYLERCELDKLPESLGNLSRLRVIDISGNNWASDSGNGTGSGLELPETVAELKQLKVLRINFNQGFKLPQALAQLQLEELEAYRCSDAGPIDFPEVICQLTALKRLDLSNNSFASIPESFLELKNLEELKLDSSLSYLEKLPALSQLPRLKMLAADGNNGHTTRPYPRQSLLRHCFTIPTLEELHIDRHGRKKEVYKPEEMAQIRANLAGDPSRLQQMEEQLMNMPNPLWGNLRYGVVREPLQAEQLQGIGNLKRLKWLDLSFNDLTELPEDFGGLQALHCLDLQYNCLNWEWRERIALAFPETRIDFRNQKIAGCRAETEQQALEAVQELMSQIKAQLNLENYPEAIACCDRALEYFETGAITDKYLLIALHHSKLDVCSRLVCQDGLPEEEIDQYRELGAAEAGVCLELVPAYLKEWHFIDEGSFYLEVICDATHCLAWRRYETSDEAEELEEALELLERGKAFREAAGDFSFRDPEVRILLKLGRVEEAYAVIRATLAAEPDFGEFQEFKDDEAYRAWVQNKAVG